MVANTLDMATAMGWKDRLRERIRELGLTHREVAERAGLKSPTHVSTMLSDKGPKNLTSSTATKLARALEVSADWLLEGSGEASPPPAPSPANDADDEPRFFTDEVEDLALRLARQPGAPEYTAREMRVAKTFLTKAATMMSPNVTRFDLLAIAAEAAREMSQAGLTPTYKDVLAVLTRKNRPAYLPPPTEETPLQKMLRRGQSDAINAGVPPHSPDDATLRANTPDR